MFLINWILWLCVEAKLFLLCGTRQSELTHIFDKLIDNEVAMGEPIEIPFSKWQISSTPNTVLLQNAAQKFAINAIDERLRIDEICETKTGHVHAEPIFIYGKFVRAHEIFLIFRMFDEYLRDRGEYSKARAKVDAQAKVFPEGCLGA